MADNHHLTMKVEPDLLRVGRFRWTLFDSGQVRERSEVSFATRREAEADGTRVLLRRIAAWRESK
jgi:hypothetical protein